MEEASEEGTELVMSRDQEKQIEIGTTVEGAKVELWQKDPGETWEPTNGGGAGSNGDPGATEELTDQGTIDGLEAQGGVAGLPD